MILVLFKNPSQRILSDPLRCSPRQELARRGGCRRCSVYMPGSTLRLERSLFPSRARARMWGGARPWQRSRSRRSRRRGCRCRSRTRCCCGCGCGCRCNCRTRNRRRSHSGGESWRCTGCWCWTGRARTKHVNKTSDRLLVPLVGGLHAGDEEATFVLVGDYRAASWKLDCAGKNVHCFAEQESIRRQELHPNSTRIRIGPPDQVNPIDRIERQRRRN